MKSETSPDQVPDSSPDNQKKETIADDEIKATQEVKNVVVKVEKAREVYEEAISSHAVAEAKPTKIEIWGWVLYGLCSYFIHTVLIPIIFPLIVSQTVDTPPEPKQGWMRSFKDLVCAQKEMQLYQSLTYKSIGINGSSISPLGWTSISWAIGLILVAPKLGLVSINLDYGQNQQLVAGTATAVGALFCLPAGFFGTRWIFPPYIAAIVSANTISTAFHARHLGLMVRGFMGSAIKKSQFPKRRSVAGWLSLYSTAAGCLGSALISAFTYHMLRKSDNFTSLWVVAIFSGLLWFVGMVHIFTSNRPGANNAKSSPGSITKTHVVSIFKYPHAAASLAGVFLSSFTTMCIFTAAVLYAIGELCLKPVNILYLWLTYFIFPLLSLPLAHPLEQLINADAVKMQLLGFLLSTITSGFGFYYRHANWNKHHLLVFAAIQSTGTGLLHAFSRVLLLDCSPAGKEGAFSVWFSWIRALGTCAGFGFASAFPGNTTKAFSIAFCAAVAGAIILIFGNISNFGGAKAAGNVKEHSENSSPVHGSLDNGKIDEKGTAKVKESSERKIEV